PRRDPPCPRPPCPTASRCSILLQDLPHRRDMFRRRRSQQQLLRAQRTEPAGAVTDASRVDAARPTRLARMELEQQPVVDGDVVVEPDGVVDARPTGPEAVDDDLAEPRPQIG